MLDDLLDFAEKKFKSRRKGASSMGSHGHDPGHGDPRSRGGLRSLVAEALDGDFGRHGTRGRGTLPGRWHDDSSDDRDDWRSSRRIRSGWDD